MSYRHISIVGHFDPSDLANVAAINPRPLRPLDAGRVGELLITYDAALAQRVWFRDGCVYGEWAQDQTGKVREFLEQLAIAENAVIIESPGFIEFPAPAAAQYMAAVKAFRDSHRVPNQH